MGYYPNATLTAACCFKLPPRPNNERTDVRCYVMENLRTGPSSPSATWAWRRLGRAPPSEKAGKVCGGLPTRCYGIDLCPSSNATNAARGSATMRGRVRIEVRRSAQQGPAYINTLCPVPGQEAIASTGFVRFPMVLAVFPPDGVVKLIRPVISPIRSVVFPYRPATVPIRCVACPY